MAEELSKTEIADEPGDPAQQSVASEMPLLRVERVAKKFGNFRAVDRLSLDIRAGEFFALFLANLYDKQKQVLGNISRTTGRRSSRSVSSRDIRPNGSGC